MLACSGPPPPKDGVPAEDSEGQAAAKPIPPVSWTERDLRLFHALNGFGLDLLRESCARTPGESVFFSPLSVSCALSIVMNGAVDSTRAAMAHAMNVAEVGLPHVDWAFSGVRTWEGAQSDDRPEIGWANALWVDQGFPLKPTFETTAKDTYGAEAAQLELQDPKSLERINGWVSDHTRKRIPSILDRIDPLAVLIVTNAVYFKGRWSHEFNPDATRDRPFTNRDGTVAQVPRMWMTREIQHGVGDGFACVALPYRGDFEMIVALPDSGRTPDDLAARFADEDAGSFLPELRHQTVDLSLPRFRMEWKKELKEELVALGMGIAFDPENADFSAMSPRGKDLWISQVVHRAFVEVDEMGTEAAAATAIVETLGVSRDRPDHPVFHVDRPFLFLIREQSTQAILFMGKIERLPA